MTTIDLVLTNGHVRLLTLGVIRTDLSDHFPTLSVVSKHRTTSKPTPIYCRDLRQFDPTTCNLELDSNLTSLLTQHTKVTPDTVTLIQFLMSLLIL